MNSGYHIEHKTWATCIAGCRSNGTCPPGARRSALCEAGFDMMLIVQWRIRCTLLKTHSNLLCNQQFIQWEDVSDQPRAPMPLGLHKQSASIPWAQETNLTWCLEYSTFELWYVCEPDVHMIPLTQEIADTRTGIVSLTHNVALAMDPTGKLYCL